MRFLVTILFSLALAFKASALLGGGGGIGGGVAFNGAPLNQPSFANGDPIVSGSFDAFGNFTIVESPASTYFNGIVYNLDPNSFSVVGNTVYSKSLLNGGVYASLMASYSPTNFAATNVIILGTVPSFFNADLSQQTNNATGLVLPTSAVAAISTDGGNTWLQNVATNVPCLVGLIDSVGANDGDPAVTIYSYQNPAAAGATNDLTLNTVYVAAASNPSSPVPLAQAQTIAQSYVYQWANYPAIAPLNLNGQPIVESGVWKESTSSNALIWTANFNNIMTFTASQTAGSRPFINGVTLAGTNVTLQVSCTTVPTIQYTAALSNVTNLWTTLPNQNSVNSGGYWYVTAPQISATNCFFRAAVSGTNTTSALMVIHAQVQPDALIFTNAAGSRFALTVNSTTNGFTFTPQ
jgi:hypothetical protein